MKINEAALKIEAYEECPCGSTKKFKFCCRQKARDAIKNKKQASPYKDFSDARINNILQNVWKDTDFKECFIKDEYCKGHIKAAHSIQNNRILNKISEEGHVYYITPKIRNHDFKVEFTKISRNKASTFFGYCDYHDTELFKPIEIIDYKNTDEQNFLFAFRGFSVAYHKKLRRMTTIRQIFKQTPSTLMHPYGVSNYRTAQLDIRDLELEYISFLTNLEEKDFSNIKTFVHELDYEVNFSISSSLSFEVDMKGEIIQEIHNLDESLVIPSTYINVFPAKGKTMIIISSHKENLDIYGSLFEQMEISREGELLDYLSYSIFNYTEDIYFKISAIDALSESKKQSMLESYTSFLDPIQAAGLVLENKYFDFNLFKL